MDNPAGRRQYGRPMESQAEVGARGHRIRKAGDDGQGDGVDGAEGAGQGGAMAVDEAGQASWLACAGPTTATEGPRDWSLRRQGGRSGVEWTREPQVYSRGLLCVAVVASGHPHRRDRAAFVEERKKRKAAQKEAAKLHKMVTLMQLAAAAAANTRAEDDARRKSEEEVRDADGSRVEKEGELGIQEERQARKLLEAEVVELGETVEAERRERKKVVERGRMEVGRREEAEARVAELETEMEEMGKAVEQAQMREVRAMREVGLGEEVESRKRAVARVMILEEESEGRVASLRKEKEGAFARAIEMVKTVAGRKAELMEKAQEIDMQEREIEGLRREVREGGRVGVSKLALGQRPFRLGTMTRAGCTGQTLPQGYAHGHGQVRGRHCLQRPSRRHSLRWLMFGRHVRPVRRTGSKTGSRAGSRTGTGGTRAWERSSMEVKYMDGVDTQRSGDEGVVRGLEL